jgi:hypothetical protein
MTRRRRLRAAIHDVLIRHWDPLGVGANPDAQDEYDSYISGIERLLRRGSDSVKLAAHLNRLEAESMGLSRHDEGRHRRAARRLLELGA